MGLLKVGVPQPWEKSKKNLSYVRQAGVRQFISTYNRFKDLKGDELLWGDEIEYGVFVLDHANKKVRLALRAKEIMDELNRREAANSHTEGFNWVPEYGAWMVEGMPARPYTGYTIDLLRVERSMRLRRKRMLTVLNEDEIAPTVSVFPVLGAMGDDGTVPPTPVGGEKAQSDYISDSVINPHPRFGTLTANIRQRRGEKVNIRVPLFRDVNTPEFKNVGVGCCGSDFQQLRRCGKEGDISHDKYGKDFVEAGCSTSTFDEEFQDSERPITLQKWLVNVPCIGCKGLFYRSAPNVIVPDPDWPRNGDIVVGSEIPDVPGWIRLQNGYYLPVASDDGKIPFLQKVSTRTMTSNTEMKRIGSGTPLFHSNPDQDNLTTLLEGHDAVWASPTTDHAIETNQEVEERKESTRAAVHMDAMAFGAGCCCLQVTIQARDVEESRFLYDQLAVMAPIMMALTASTPILKGRIVDTDARWSVIGDSCDCRTPGERGRPDPNAPYDDLAGKGKRRVYKSRWGSISAYIYQGVVGDEVNAPLKGGLANRVLNVYNDIPVPVDEDRYQQLRSAGVDPALSQHIAHLFIRDPLVIFDGAIEELDDETQTEHFESIQSTNWQTVRWKPPPPRRSPNDPHIGWRTEFRSMEIQLTDFENAAFSVFIVLLTRVILVFDLNLYIPMSRVDANMQRAHSRNASAKGKFFFRRHIRPLEERDDVIGVQRTSIFLRAATGHDSAKMFSRTENGHDKPTPLLSTHLDDEQTNVDYVSELRRSAPVAPGSDEENSYEEMTMAEIMTGKGDYFPGLIPLIDVYLEYINCDNITRERLKTYLDFIEGRAVGRLVTPATWMRNYVRTHPAYRGDSVVSDEIAFDLMIACKDIGMGKLHIPELLGSVHIDPITTERAYDVTR